MQTDTHALVIEEQGKQHGADFLKTTGVAKLIEVVGVG
jgi:hypothetical protein